MNSRCFGSFLACLNFFIERDAFLLGKFDGAEMFLRCKVCNHSIDIVGQRIFFIVGTVSILFIFFEVRQEALRVSILFESEGSITNFHRTIIYSIVNQLSSTK